MKKYLFILIAFITFAIGIFAFASLKNKPKTSEVMLPPIVSKIETLEIINIKLKHPESPDAMISIKLRNNSTKSIVTVNIESGDDKDSSGNTISGFGTNPSKPTVQPLETFDIDFPLSNVIRGLPIRINGVFYADGSGDGEAKALERMRSFRDRN